MNSAGIQIEFDRQRTSSYRNSNKLLRNKRPIRNLVHGKQASLRWNPRTDMRRVIKHHVVELVELVMPFRRCNWNVANAVDHRRCGTISSVLDSKICGNK